MATEMETTDPRIVVAQTISTLFVTALASLSPRDRQMFLGISLLTLGVFLLANADKNHIQI